MDGQGAQRRRFLDLVRANPVNAALLDRLADLALPDGGLVSGCLFQTVWNGLTGRPPTYGILDYDVFYCHTGDLSWEAEDAVIRRCATAFADLGAEVQVRNQARVHLWYPDKHGVACLPLTSSRAAIDTFLCRSACVGIFPAPGGRLDVHAPFGFDDLFAMVVRPNPVRGTAAAYHRKARRWQQAWPGLTVLPWPDTR
ncbi:MAG: nucleotidyltransferase family protein [Rhodospirillaceae bacterium]|nr:nucleotidyltransferase family protein [Rhodospirillaceae bacterium]